MISGTYHFDSAADFSPISPDDVLWNTATFEIFSVRMRCRYGLKIITIPHFDTVHHHPSGVGSVDSRGWAGSVVEQKCATRRFFAAHPVSVNLDSVPDCALSGDWHDEGSLFALEYLSVDVGGTET